MITIAQRLKPFSHQPCTRCLIPATSYVVEAFPALIRIKDLSDKVVKEIVIEVQGPLKQFTVVQDLERGCVTLFSGQYRFHILPNLEVSFQKNPPLMPLKVQERLSLGSHKKQEWCAIQRRCDFSEIFPLWFRLGSLLTLPPRKGDDKGVFLLLKACKEALETHRPEMILSTFEKLFLCGFENLLLPRLWDTDHQGILQSQTFSEGDSPLYLLAEGAAMIRSLFFLASENEFSILPNLPPQFSAGRLIHLASSYGTVDLEWSKKNIRQLHFHAARDGEITLHFQSPLSKFRIRQNGKERGKGDGMWRFSGN